MEANDNALVKRLDKWMKNIFIATDEYLSHGDMPMPMEQPPSMPIPTVKPKRKYTKKDKNILDKPVIMEQKTPTPIPTPIVQKARKEIPIYMPPEPYTEQQDSYMGYDTHGDYGYKNLVFPTIDKYMEVLNACKHAVLSLGITNKFCTMLDKQITELDNPILLDFMHAYLVNYGQIVHDMSHEDNTDENLLEDASKKYEEIDNMLDKIALCQYSLDPDKYEQFLTDLQTMTCKKPTVPQLLSIGKNFLIKYKFVTKDKLSKILPGMSTITELITGWNRHMQSIKDKEQEAIRMEKQRVKDLYQKQQEYSIERAFAPPPKRPSKK